MSKSNFEPHTTIGTLEIRGVPHQVVVHGTTVTVYAKTPQAARELVEYMSAVAQHMSEPNKDLAPKAAYVNGIDLAPEKVEEIARAAEKMNETISVLEDEAKAKAPSKPWPKIGETYRDRVVTWVKPHPSEESCAVGLANGDMVQIDKHGEEKLYVPMTQTMVHQDDEPDDAPAPEPELPKITPRPAPTPVQDSAKPAAKKKAGKKVAGKKSSGKKSAGKKKASKKLSRKRDTAHARTLAAVRRKHESTKKVGKKRSAAKAVKKVTAKAVEKAPDQGELDITIPAPALPDKTEEVHQATMDELVEERLNYPETFEGRDLLPEFEEMPAQVKEAKKIRMLLVHLINHFEEQGREDLSKSVKSIRAAAMVYKDQHPAFELIRQPERRIDVLLESWGLQD